MRNPARVHIDKVCYATGNGVRKMPVLTQGKRYLVLRPENPVCYGVARQDHRRWTSDLWLPSDVMLDRVPVLVVAEDVFKTKDDVMR